MLFGPWAIRFIYWINFVFELEFKLSSFSVRSPIFVWSPTLFLVFSAIFWFISLIRDGVPPVGPIFLTSF